MTVILSSPSIPETRDALTKAVEARLTCVIVASCTVTYSGRTGSKLGSGERVITIKEDGCVLVHRGRDYQPVNWQPGGGIVQAHSHDGGLMIRAVRANPLESLNILLQEVRFFGSFKLVDEAEFFLHANEHDMQRAIIVQPSLVEAGLIIVEYERRVEPGFVDIYAQDRKGNTVVIEIKKDPAGISAVKQLAEYLKYIQPRPGRKLRPVIVAPALAKGTQTMISRMGFEYKQLSLQKCADVLRRHAVSQKQPPLGSWLPQVGESVGTETRSG